MQNKGRVRGFVYPATTYNILCILSRDFETCARSLLLEEGEMNAAVGACLYVTHAGCEIGIFAVLNHKPAAFFENVLTEYHIRQGRQLLQGVRRVSEDKVVLRTAGGKELKHIPSDDGQVTYAELLAAGNNPVLLHMRNLHRRHFPCSPADALDTYTACSGKEIQHVNAFKIHPIIEQIKQTLLGEVGCRPRGDIFRGRQSPPPVYARDNAHL